jgi:hypothetical protein
LGSNIFACRRAPASLNLIVRRHVLSVVYLFFLGRLAMIQPPQPRSEKHYRNSLMILLADYTYTRLEANQRAHVDAKVKEDLNGFLFGIAWFEFDRLFSPAMRAAFRAYAMAALGISPAVSRESWTLPKSRRLPYMFNTSANKLIVGFRPLSPETKMTREYISSKGVDLQVLKV